MNLLLYLEIDAIGLVLTVLMLFNLHNGKSGHIPLDQKIFKQLLYTNTLLLILDAAMWALNRQQFAYARQLHIIATILYFVLSPVLCFQWLYYCESKLKPDAKILLRRLPLYSLPLVANTIVAVLSPITGWLFFINANNTYHRGALLPIQMLLCAVYFIYSIFIAVLHARQQDALCERNLYRNLILFPLIPFTAAIVQTLYYGTSLIWIATSLSLLVIYINLQNTLIITDPLTGLYNRRQLERYLRYQTTALAPGQILFVILIDLDHFKQINDQYGHAVGDDALRQAAALLQIDNGARRDLWARLGGDEFVFAGCRESYDALEDTISCIQKRFSKWQPTPEQPYSLSISLGYAVLGEDNVFSADDLLAAADRKMYSAK